MFKISSIINAALKQSCVLCDDIAQNKLSICSHCLLDLPLHRSESCEICGLPAPSKVCGHCLKSAPAYDRTYAVFNYAYPIDGVLQRYKYHEAIHLSQTLGQLLADKIAHLDVDLMIPMPLHPARLKERGFNQSLEIARVIAKLQHRQMDYLSCTRIKNTPPQANLTLEDRIKNVKGAFHCQLNLSAMKIGVVDDVMTSGASLNELAKTLKKAGAASVTNLVLARTL